MSNDHEHLLHNAASHPVDHAASGFGILLLEAREKAGLSREDLSNRLHIRIEILKAMEEEQLHNLPEATYVRGYLRACARVFEVNPEPWLAAFDRKTQPAQIISNERTKFKALEPEHTHTTAAEEKTRNSLASLYKTREWHINPYVLGGILLVGIVALVSYGLSGHGTKEAIDAPERLAFMPAEPPAEPPALSQLPTETITERIPEQTESGTASPAISPQPETPEPTEILPAPGVQTSSVVAPTLPGRAKINLRFTEDSWVEIRDASGNRVLVGLMRAGQERSLEANLPLRFVLGNAPGVRMQLNDNPYDLNPHQRAGDSVARFTLER